MKSSLVRNSKYSTLTPVRKEWDSMKIMRVKDWVKVPALIVKRVVRYNDFTGQVKEIIWQILSWKGLEFFSEKKLPKEISRVGSCVRRNLDKGETLNTKGLIIEISGRLPGKGGKGGKSRSYIWKNGEIKSSECLRYGEAHEGRLRTALGEVRVKVALRL